MKLNNKILTTKKYTFYFQKQQIDDDNLYDTHFYTIRFSLKTKNKHRRRLLMSINGVLNQSIQKFTMFLR